MADVVDTVGAFLEQVRPILQEVFETSDQISALFKKNSSNVKNLTRWLYRIPLLQYRGGSHKKYSANEGSLGKGTGMKVTYLQAGYIYTITMFRVTDEQVDLSQNTKQSVVNVMSETLAHGMIESQVYDDQALHGDGTGKLTNAASATNGTTTLTFADPVDKLGVSKLREGMSVDVWNSAGTTKRAGAGTAPIRIETIDDSTQTVTLNQTITAIAATDLLSFYDVDVYGPATLLTGQSGWPATGALTTTGGLTGDSFRHGIYYAHDSSTANYYLGKLKSTLPQIVAINIDADGNPITFAHGLLGQDKIRKRRTPDAVNGLIGIFPMAQRAGVMDLGIAISNKLINGEKFGKSLDLMPDNTGYTETFEYCGMKCYVSKRQPNDRVDFCNLQNWARAEVFPLRPYKRGNVTEFQGHDTNGLLAAYSEFGFHSAYDFVCYDPGAEFYITELEVPDGY